MGARQVDEETIRSWIAENGGSSPGSSYLVYTALLSQSGTGAPIARVLQNTLGGIPIYSRDSAGTYLITLTGVFTIDKTVVIISGNNDHTFYAWGDWNQPDELLITTYEDPNLIDNRMDDTLIEIRVYS